MAHPTASLPAPSDNPSVLGMINQAHRRLEHLLFNLQSEAGEKWRSGVLDVARELVAAADRNSDIALACILLNQDEGSYAVRHCIDTALVALLAARALRLGQNEISSVMAAALTMNVGMLQNHEQFQSRLGAISEREQAVIRAHPEHGTGLLRQAGVDDPDWLSYVLLHHENEDGSGYPFGRRGGDVPLGAKIISLADRYCARVSTRGYRKSLLPDEALRDILLVDHESVDPMLTACFIDVLGVYPIGAVVRLADGTVGVVAGRGRHGSRPRVQVLLGGDGAPLPAPIPRDSDDPAYAVSEMISAEKAGIRFRMHQVWGEAARP